MSAASRPLPVLKLLLGAFAVPWRLRRALARALLFPALAWIAMKGGWILSVEHLPRWSYWPLLALHGILFAVFAVRVHRVVLLGAAGAPPSAFDWTARETRFVLWLAGAYAVTLVANVLVGLLVMTPVAAVLGRAAFEDAGPLTVPRAIVALPFAYVYARLSLVLPAVALDRRASFVWAWHRSAGNGWRLVLVLAGLAWVFDALLDLAWRATLDDLSWLLLLALGVVVVVFEVAALSLCYRELGADAGEPAAQERDLTWLAQRPRWQRWLAATAVAIGVAPLVLGVFLRSPCEATRVRSERAPDGTAMVRLLRETCRDRDAQFTLWLEAPDGAGRRIYHGPVQAEIAGRAVATPPAWVWLDNRALEIRVPEAARSAGAPPASPLEPRSFAGVDVTYRVVPADAAPPGAR